MRLFFIFCLVSILALLCPAQNSAAWDTTRPTEKKLQEGINYYKQKDFEKASHALQESANMARQEKNNRVLTSAYNNLGNVYADKGDNPQALNYYQKALQIAESAADRRNIARIEKNIGVLYISWKRFETALAFYDKALRQAIILKDSLLIADCFNNKGTVHEQQENYSEALSEYKTALAYYERTGANGNIAMALSNIAIVYRIKKDYAASLLYNKRSLQISEKLGDKWMAASILNNIGNLYGETGNYTEAIDYCHKSLALANEISAHEIIVAVYGSMADAAAKKGRFNEAFEYHKKFAEQKDLFINTESTQQLQELQVKYETEKKENENRRLKYENELKDAQKEKAQKEKNAVLLISLLIVVFLLIIFFLIVRYNNSRQKYREEQLMNKTAFETEQQERYRIARDLHDSVGMKLSVVKMLFSVTLSSGDENAEKPSRLLDEAIQEVRNISHNLIPEELHFGLIKALNYLADNINQSGVCKAEAIISPEAETQVFSKQFEIPVFRIIQEITGNMLRHAQASRIRIRLDYKDNCLLLRISDNGKGFDVKLLKKSEGLGWKNTQARVNLLNGKITIESLLNKGTSVEIDLPYVAPTDALPMG